MGNSAYLCLQRLCLQCLGIVAVLFSTACAPVPDDVPNDVDLGPGVSRSLAELRASPLSDIRYEILLSIPEAKSNPIEGRVIIRLTIADSTRPLVLDFTQPGENVHSVSVAGSPVDFEVRDEHLSIDAQHFEAGANEVSIEFVAGDGSLNRGDDFLYTLFVPDRARVALPGQSGIE